MRWLVMTYIWSLHSKLNQKWQLQTGLPRVGLSHFSYDLTDSINILNCTFQSARVFILQLYSIQGNPMPCLVLTLKRIPGGITKFPKGASALAKERSRPPRSEADSSDARRFLLLDGHNFPKLGTDWSTAKNKLIRCQRIIPYGSLQSQEGGHIQGWRFESTWCNIRPAHFLGSAVKTSGDPRMLVDLAANLSSSFKLTLFFQSLLSQWHP